MKKLAKAGRRIGKLCRVYWSCFGHLPGGLLAIARGLLRFSAESEGDFRDA